MDKDLEILEKELTALRPRLPGRTLDGRIAARLQPRRPAQIVWLALPLAAAVAVVFAWQMPRGVTPPPVAEEANPSPAKAESQFKPVATQNLLYDARDEGVVTLADGSKARRVSRSYVDTVVWRDPRSNASIKWSVPRDEVRLTHLTLQ
ncbi:MAG: hypothetical protein ACO3DQ_00010 [Cephaloticoccus sp.]